MKRLVVLLSVLSMVFGIVAFDCSSSEMTAAKMYMADNVKNYAKAREMLNAEIAKNPKNDEAFYYLGRLDGIEGKYSQMVGNFGKSVGISPKFKMEIDQEKNFYLKTVADKGNAYFNRSSRLKGDSAKAGYAKAMAAFQDAMEIAPDSSFACENFVYSAINAEKLDVIEAPLKKLVTMGKAPLPFTLLGRFYLDKGNKAKDANNSAESAKYYTEAINVLNAGKAKFGNDKDIFENLANAYVMSNRIEEAKTSFAEGVQAQPNNKILRYNYGTILLNVNDFTGAEEQLKKAIELDPSYLSAIYNGALCYVKWGVDLNEKATKAGINSQEYKEKVKLALPLLNKYIEVKSDDAEAWELLGQAHTALGNGKEAEEAFKKADQFKNK